jgi:hypothetical protein
MLVWVLHEGFLHCRTSTKRFLKATAASSPASGAVASGDAAGTIPAVALYAAE